jgi:hypothetical protein
VHRLELYVYCATLSTTQNVSAIIVGWSHEQPSIMSIYPRRLGVANVMFYRLRRHLFTT